MTEHPGMNNDHRNTLSSPPSIHRPPNPTAAPGLAHVTQIGNNTGSLPGEFRKYCNKKDIGQWS